MISLQRAKPSGFDQRPTIPKTMERRAPPEAVKQKVPNLKAEARTDSGLAGRVTVESGMSIVQTVKKMNVGEVNTAAIHDKNKQKEAESKTNDAWASVFRDGSPKQVKRDEAAGEELRDNGGRWRLQAGA